MILLPKSIWHAALCVNEILTTNVMLCVRGNVLKNKEQPERFRMAKTSFIFILYKPENTLTG
jgi:hypothetical protein